MGMAGIAQGWNPFPQVDQGVLKLFDVILLLCLEPGKISARPLSVYLALAPRRMQDWHHPQRREAYIVAGGGDQWNVNLTVCTTFSWTIELFARECESTFDFLRKVSEKYVTQRSHLFSMHKAIKNPCIWVLSSNHRPHCFSNDFSTSSFDQGLLDWKAKFLSLLAWFLHQKASQICCLADFFRQNAVNSQPI